MKPPLSFFLFLIGKPPLSKWGLHLFQVSTSKTCICCHPNDAYMTWKAQRVKDPQQIHQHKPFAKLLSREPAQLNCIQDNYIKKRILQTSLSTVFTPCISIKNFSIETNNQKPHEKKNNESDSCQVHIIDSCSNLTFKFQHNDTFKIMKLIYAHVMHRLIKIYI